MSSTPVAVPTEFPMPIDGSTAVQVLNPIVTGESYRHAKSTLVNQLPADGKFVGGGKTECCETHRVVFLKGSRTA